MARIRDLGINVIPVTMRPLEIGPGAAVDIPVGQATPYHPYGGALFACEACPCDPNSERGETSGQCPDDTGCVPTHPEPPDGYHASGFTLQSVAALKQQLQTRRKELNQ